MAIEARAKEDPVAAREALRRMLDNGRIEMHPQPDGSYRAESVIFPLILAWKIRRRKARKPRKSETAEASEVVRTMVARARFTPCIRIIGCLWR